MTKRYTECEGESRLPQDPGPLSRGVRFVSERKWIWGIVAVVAAVGLIWWAWDVVSGSIGIRALWGLVSQTLQDFAAVMGPWGPLLMILALAAHSVVFVFPMEIPTLASFGLYGPWGGLAIVWSGSMVTAAISYALGRWIGPPVLKRWEHNAKVKEVQARVEHLNPLALILLRWISLIPFDVLNMMFGAGRVPIFRFAWTTAIGVLVTNVVMAALYRSAIHAHWGQLLGIAVVLVATGWGVWLWSRRQTRRHTVKAPHDPFAG